MPYGIKNESPEQTKWMERCVDSITGTNPRTGKPYKEGERIAICKWNLKKHGMKKESSSEISMREELYELEKKIREVIVGPANDTVKGGPWVADIFDDYVIVDNNAKMYKVPYSMDGDSITVDWNNAVEVERKTVYEPVSESAKKTGTTRITYGTRTI